MPGASAARKLFSYMQKFSKIINLQRDREGPVAAKASPATAWARANGRSDFDPGPVQEDGGGGGIESSSPHDHDVWPMFSDPFARRKKPSRNTPCTEFHKPPAIGTATVSPAGRQQARPLRLGGHNRPGDEARSASARAPPGSGRRSSVPHSSGTTAFDYFPVDTYPRRSPSGLRARFGGMSEECQPLTEM